MEFFLTLLFTSAVQYFLNRIERGTAKQDTLDIQHDAQDFNHDEAEIAFERQSDFWRENQSPEALVKQYRNLGASETASLMSAFGVSPSVASSPSASSSSASGLGAGVNTISDLFNSISGGFNQFMQGNKAAEETKWVGAVNDANIKSTLGQLELNWKKFGLDKDTFEYISKPLAQMSYDKSLQEIEESKARMREADAKVLQIDQQIKESQQNVKESIARTDLYNAQTETEGFKQENIAADTSLKGAQKGLVESQTKGQDIQNALDSISLEMSQNLGMDVRLNVVNQSLYASAKFMNESIIVPWEEFSKSVEKTFDGLSNGIRYQDISRKAVDHVERFLSNPFYPHYNVFDGNNKGFGFNQNYQQWLRKHGKKYKELEDWINRNTRYGM